MEVESVVESTSTKNTEESVDARNTEEIIEDQRKKDEAEKIARAGRCAEEIKGVLAKWNCDFDVSVLLRPNGVFPNIQIITKEQK